MKKQFTHPLLGKIEVTENSRSRSISMRPKADVISVTVPPFTSQSVIIEALNKYSDKLQRKQQAIPHRMIDEHFSINAPFFQLTMSPGIGQHFQVTRNGSEVFLYYPPQTVFSDDASQHFLHEAIEQTMRKQAKLIFPSRLYMLAQKHDFQYNALHIQSSQSRWGSCSGQKSINLSIYLLLLPEHLIDYVMLHELCHTREMNHSERFWQLMDKVTDGKAKQHRAELKQYRTDFL